MKEKTIPIESVLLMGRSKLADYFELTKFRLLLLVVVTSGIGFYLSTPQTINWILFLSTCLGVGCIGAGANTLNQWYERHLDPLMNRTKNRPIPSGRLSSTEAFWFGISISSFGVLWLVFTVNLLTATLGILTWASYLLLYTPLKQRTSLNTWIGAIPGAIPPLMGWTAASGTLTPEAFIIFTILYFWQLPHFFAISWIYRDDYIRGGFHMLSRNDPHGEKTSYQMLFNAVLLFFASISLYFTQQTGPLYLVSAIVLGLSFIVIITFFFKKRSITNARRVFRASIVYFPILWMMMILDRMMG